MSVGVYEIRHRASGYVYVGASIDLERREFEWKLAFDWCAGRVGRQRGRYRFKRPSARFQSAFRKVGPEGWTFEVVFRLPADASPAGEVLWSHECAFIELAFAEVGREKLLNSYCPGTPYPFGFRPKYISAV